MPNFIGRQAAWLPFNEACPYYLISCGGELAPRFLNTPLHQPGLKHLTLSAEECRVINLHRNLDEWCGATR